MARRRHAMHEEPEEAHNSERWLLTYADMITLLLALFIVLFAASTISTKKFLSLAIGFRQAFNPSPGLLQNSNGLLKEPNLSQAGSEKGLTGITSLEATTTTTATISSGPTAGQQSLTTIQHQIRQALAAKGLSGMATASIQSSGLVIQILADKVFFATDSAELGAVGDEVVDTVASVLRTDANNVVVEGYTDNQPITGGPYTSNMELSAMRAVNVTVRLYTVDGIDQNRLSAIGFGPTHPAVPNTSPANMALNRRIDVVVLAPGQSAP